MALSIRHNELKVLQVFTHLSVFWPTFYKTPPLLLHVGWISFTCNSVKMLKQLHVWFFFSPWCLVFQMETFVPTGVARLCFTWKYYLYPHDLWWLFSCAFLSQHHHLYCRTEGNKKHKTHARWGLGQTCCSHKLQVTFSVFWLIYSMQWTFLWYFEGLPWDPSPHFCCCWLCTV